MNGFSNGMNANRVRNRVCLCLCVDRTKQARASYAKGYSQTSSQATYHLYLHGNRFVKDRPQWPSGLGGQTLAELFSQVAGSNPAAVGGCQNARQSCRHHLWMVPYVVKGGGGGHLCFSMPVK